MLRCISDVNAVALAVSVYFPTINNPGTGFRTKAAGDAICSDEIRIIIYPDGAPYCVLGHFFRGNRAFTGIIQRDGNAGHSQYHAQP
jgi:hypothetical protein